MVLTMPLLEGLDGVQKMSKSLGNYVAIHEPAEQMFGKLMSISDPLMWRYFELLSLRPGAEIAALQVAVQHGRNPRDVKFELAQEIVTRFHSRVAAEEAQRQFIARFQQGVLPENLEEKTLMIEGGSIRLSAALKALGLVVSTSEAMRKIDEGAVRIDQQKVNDRQAALSAGQRVVLSVGRRTLARVHVQKQKP